MAIAETPDLNGNGHTDTPKSAAVGAVKPKLVPSAAHLRRTKGWQERFLKALANTGIVVASAKSAGISPKYAYEYREKHPKFGAQMEEAINQSTALIELNAINLAINGEKETVFMNSKNGPVVAGERWRKSPRMIEFLLKSRLPDKYGDKLQTEVTGKDGAPLQIAPAQVSQIIFNIPGNGRADPCHQVTDIQSVSVDIPKKVSDNGA